MNEKEIELEMEPAGEEIAGYLQDIMRLIKLIMLSGETDAEFKERLHQQLLEATSLLGEIEQHYVKH